jgi:chromosome partitioning protein
MTAAPTAVHADTDSEIPRQGRQDAPKVVVVVQQKGGTGKSTITVNLAAVSGRSAGPVADDEGSPVVAAGIDVQGTLERWCAGVRETALPMDYLVTKGKVGILPAIAGDTSRRRVFVDTPGFIDVDPDTPWGEDPLGTSRSADALREVLELADLAIVPITPSKATWEEAETTIELILKPRRIPFLVVVNMHDPSDDRNEVQLDKARRFVTDRAYRLAPAPIRRYKIHEHAYENGLLVTEYRKSGTALNAREDFMQLALAVEQML